MGGYSATGNRAIATPPSRMVTHAITFGFGVPLGPSFAVWGWGTTHVAWATHTVVINNAPWRRTWVNRATYVHPYEIRRPADVRRGDARRVEEHHVERRTEHEREQDHEGKKREETHRRSGG